MRCPAPRIDVVSRSSKKMKEIAKRLMPESLLQLFRGIREATYRMRQTYSGVYARFEDVAEVGGGYEDDEWPKTAARYSRWAIVNNESGFIPGAVSNEAALLPLLVSISRAARVLDFGGATGFSYIATKYGALRGIDRHVIVEHQNVCTEGRKLFKDDPKVEFLTNIPQEQFDLVHIGSALQYVSNYKELLKRLTDLKPRWILMTKLPAGDNVTFVTAQVNLPGKKFANWLFNAQELVRVMESLGYTLIFRSANDGQVNQGNVEPDYRLERFSNLLFELAGS
jgi:putative methyltransferase (TIGR04325 family)